MRLYRSGGGIRNDDSGRGDIRGAGGAREADSRAIGDGQGDDA